MPTRQAIIQTATSYFERRIRALNAKQEDQLEAIDPEGEPTDLDDHSFINQIIGEQVEREAEQIDQMQDHLANLRRMAANQQGPDRVQFGAVVETDQLNFLVGVPMRRFEVEGKTFVGLSTDAPLGQAMQGQALGETVSYQGNKFVIEKIY
jgi:hypothetical protein